MCVLGVLNAIITYTPNRDYSVDNIDLFALISYDLPPEKSDYRSILKSNQTFALI